MTGIVKTAAGVAAAGFCVRGATESVRADYASDLASLNPVSYWRLGESVGTTAFDEMGIQNGTYKKNAVLGAPGADAGD